MARGMRKDLVQRFQRAERRAPGNRAVELRPGIAVREATRVISIGRLKRVAVVTMASIEAQIAQRPLVAQFLSHKLFCFEEFKTISSVHNPFY